MKRGRSLLEWKGLLVIVFSCCCLFWPYTAAAQADKALEAPGQNEEVQLTYQDYTNLIAGRKIDANVLARVVSPQGWLEYAEDTDSTWQRFEQKNLEPIRGLGHKGNWLVADGGRSGFLSF